MTGALREAGYNLIIVLAGEELPWHEEFETVLRIIHCDNKGKRRKPRDTPEVTLITNGSRLGVKEVRNILRTYPASIRISLDVIEEPGKGMLHNRIPGGMLLPHTLSLRDEMRALHADKDIDVTVATSFDGTNIDGLIALGQQVLGAGADLWLMQMLLKRVGNHFASVPGIRQINALRGALIKTFPDPKIVLGEKRPVFILDLQPEQLKRLAQVAEFPNAPIPYAWLSRPDDQHSGGVAQCYNPDTTFRWLGFRGDGMMLPRPKGLKYPTNKKLMRLYTAGDVTAFYKGVIQEKQ